MRGVDSLDRLVTELVEYGRMKTATLQLSRVETSLSSIVSDTCELLQPLVEGKALVLKLDAPSTLPRVSVDPHLVQQILVNLITNAINFTPKGGLIAVRVSREGDHLLTQVEDSGLGIPEQQMPGSLQRSTHLTAALAPIRVLDWASPSPRR